MGAFVNVQVADGVATMRLDRPPMNAISVAVQEELRQAAAEVTTSPRHSCGRSLRWGEDVGGRR